MEQAAGASALRSEPGRSIIEFVGGDDEAGASARLFAVLSALRASDRGLPANLTEAALVGDLAAIDTWLARGADLEERTVGFASPLAAAASAGQLAAVRRLLDRGAALAPDGAVITPLHAAIAHGHREVLAELVARGGRLSSTLTDVVAGFLAACARGHTRILRDVVAAGLDLDAAVDGASIRTLGIDAARASGLPSRVEDFLHDRPVSEAALAEEEALRRDERRAHTALLAGARGEEPVASEGERPALLAEAVRLLASPGAGARLDADGESVLGLAARTGALELVAAALAAGGDPRHRGAVTGMTPLHRAAQIGCRAIADCLLERGADPDAAAAGRTTPLMLAARFGRPDLVAALLAAGASPAAKDVNGWDARRHASGPHSDQLAQLLSARARRKEPRR